jgi:hypothetical protein
MCHASRCCFMNIATYGEGRRRQLVIVIRLDHVVAPSVCGGKRVNNGTETAREWFIGVVQLADGEIPNTTVEVAA